MTNAIIAAGTAAEINRLHQAAQRCAGEALQCAKQAGDLLLQAKAALPHGEWLPWLDSNVEVTARQAQKYMRLSKNWEAIGANTNSTSHLGSAGIEAALEHLSEPREPKPRADHPERVLKAVWESAPAEAKEAFRFLLDVESFNEGLAILSRLAERYTPEQMRESLRSELSAGEFDEAMHDTRAAVDVLDKLLTIHRTADGRGCIPA